MRTDNMRPAGVLDSVYAVPCHVTGVVEQLFDGSYDVVRGHCAGQHFELQACATLRLLQGGSGAADGEKGEAQEDTGKSPLTQSP